MLPRNGQNCIGVLSRLRQEKELIASLNLNVCACGVTLRHGQNFARDPWAGRARPDEFNCTSFIDFFKRLLKGSKLLVRRVLLRMSPPVKFAQVTFA